MPDTTVVGFFESPSKAEIAKNRLINAQISGNDIQVLDDAAQLTNLAREEKRGFFSKLKEMFGGSSDYSSDFEHYQEGMRRGGAILSVSVNDEDVTTVTEILESSGATDINEKGEEWRSQGWTETSRTGNNQQMSRETQQAQTDRSIPVVEETLKVGKRQRQNRAVRVYRRVVETPVEQTVDLTDEKVVVERTRVDRPADRKDLQFEEKTIDVIETTEEPVVSKEAHVIEEVKVSKQRQKRQETVKDTLRKTEVEVQEGGQPRSNYQDDLETRYSQHFQQRYASAGHQFNEYAPAYRFGSEYASGDQYRNRNWDSVEQDIRTSWEGRGVGAWENFKDAIRHGWDLVRGRHAA
jgi:uncharacterized protein (TIGR02271 family)